jgi:uncharacterized protein DUF3617
MPHAIVAAATLALTSGFALAASHDVPKRKPGLWEMTTVAAGTGMTTVRACIGPDDSLVTPQDSGDCSEPKVRRVDDNIFVDVVCNKPYGQQIMSTALTGDFEKRYRATMKITFDPPEGMPNEGAIIDGRYIGPKCDPATFPSSK